MVFLVQQQPWIHLSQRELEVRPSCRTTRGAKSSLPIAQHKKLNAHIALAIAMAALFGVLAASQGHDDAETSEAILSELRTIQINCALMQRDVFQARAEMLWDLPAVGITKEVLGKSLTNLQQLLERVPYDNSYELSRLFKELRASIEITDVAVSALATHAALLRASLATFERSVQTIPGTASNKPDLSTLVLTFSARPNASLASHIDQHLSLLSPSDNPANRQIIRSGRAVLSLLPKLTDSAERIASSDTIAKATELEQEHRKSYSLASSRVQRTRAFCVRLCLCLSFVAFALLFRLHLRTNRLTRRLELESAVSEIEACFGGDQATKALPNSPTRSALRAVQRAFNADQCALALVSAGIRRNAECFVANTRMPVWKATLIDQATSLVESGEPVFRVVSAQEVVQAAQYASGVCQILACKVCDDQIAVCCLVFKERQLLPAADELRIFARATMRVCNHIRLDRMHAERNDSAKRLEQAERLTSIGTIASSVAHEFNNILAAILGYAELAHGLLRRRSKTRAYISQIILASNRAKMIIDQILSLSRNRKRPITPFDVSEVVIELAPLLRVSIGAKAQLILKVKKWEAVIDGSPTDIQKILLNLCKNSSDAFSNGGRIEVSVSRAHIYQAKTLTHAFLTPGDYVVLSVSDDGPGIQGAVLPRIFESFFTTRLRTGGTGLGLAAVLSDVNALTGHLDVASTVGKGTRFDIYLPASKKESLTTGSPFRTFGQSPGNGEIVAVVAGRRATLKAYEDKISALGYVPVGFRSVKSLGDWISSGNAPDLVIYDQSMAGRIPAKATCAALKTVPVILVGRMDRDVPHTCDDHSFVLWLAEPVSYSKLAYAIRMMIIV
ncbi:two-component system VirA-like sensor kinase [Mesorhizobium hawassense]|nr:two-component system VirA-like sensor kinase [Mesorhizobium hawassense]